MSDQVKKIVLLGAESTGKTCLAQKLAHRFRTSWNPEYVRQYLDVKLRNGLVNTSQLIQYEEVEAICIGQIASEDQSISQAYRYVFFDTNILMNRIYSQYYFGKSPLWLDEEIRRRKYDLYLFMDTDIPWESDDQRDSPVVRNEIQEMLLKELTELAVPFIKISGTYEDRFKRATNMVRKIR